MKLFRPLLAGLTLPAVMLPFLLLFFYFFKGGFSVLFLIAPFVPLVWGFWNILFINFESISPIIDRDINIWLWGALLGLIFVSLMSLFGFTKSLLNIEGFMTYGIFFLVPFLYGIIWRYFVKNINESLDLF
jgi:hypothetical protein